MTIVVEHTPMSSETTESDTRSSATLESDLARVKAIAQLKFDTLNAKQQDERTEQEHAATAHDRPLKLELADRQSEETSTLLARLASERAELAGRHAREKSQLASKHSAETSDLAVTLNTERNIGKKQLSTRHTAERTKLEGMHRSNVGYMKSLIKAAKMREKEAAKVEVYARQLAAAERASEQQRAIDRRRLTKELEKAEAEQAERVAREATNAAAREEARKLRD